MIYQYHGTIKGSRKLPSINIFEGYVNEEKLPSTSVGFSLQPNTAYTVDVAVAFESVASVGIDATPAGWSDSSDVTVMMDPAISFDQAAFNQMYGANAFNLADYYSIELSPNVPLSTTAPEPSALLLPGIGLIGLA